MSRFRTGTAFLALSAASLFLLAGCSSVGDMFSSDDKKPLPGERIPVLALEKQLEPESAALKAQGFIAPDAWRNEFWPQAGGYPNHAMQNLALGTGALHTAWTAKIGEGASRSLPLTAQPVVVDGRVFTLDTDSHLSAFDAQSGKPLWSVSVRPDGEDEAVIGGGLAYSAGTIYVTTGYAGVLALDPDNGKVRWKSDISSPARAAPSVVDNRVFVTTLDNRLIALDTASGKNLWEYAGINDAAGLVGAASPAATSDIVIPAFSSGEIVALRVENGAVAWSDTLSSAVRSDNLAGLSDISGLPVIDKGTVFAVSFGGGLVAIDERTGTRIWQREISGSDTPWVAGNHLFVVTTDNRLVALGRDTGAIRWVSSLQKGAKDEPVLWSGPVLAGGRLILVNTRGLMIEVSPETGELIRSQDLGAPVSMPPLVAGETLYILADNGTLMALR